ncbi:MAG: amidohydrolase family protein, partial [Boseongicola sp.]|nr:amidohydrolase family protein [Boseongicola sp.]
MTLPNANLPVVRPTKPAFQVPENACDSHVHMVAGAGEFPRWEGRVEDPAPGLNLDAWLELFETHLATLGMARTVIVHTILYGADNSVTIEAVRRLGARARGVGLLKDGAKESDIRILADANLMAVRLNYVHGGVLTWDGAKDMAPALADHGMHIQMLAHADKHLLELTEDVIASPCPVVFDHCGWPAEDMSLHSAGFQALLRLVGDGHAWVKLSAIYRVARDWNIGSELALALVRANPEQCLWGSDWPHLMLGPAEMPDAGQLLNAFGNIVTDDETRKLVLSDN